MKKRTKYLIVMISIIVTITIMFSFLYYIFTFGSIELFITPGYNLKNYYLDNQKEYNLLYTYDDLTDLEEYLYDFPKDNKGNYIANIDIDEPFNLTTIDKDYVIVTIKNDYMHSFNIDKHIMDQLLYLNDESGCAEVVFETYNYDFILYGTREIVIIYKHKKKSVQYISIYNKEVLKEIPISLKNNYDYYVEINKEKNVIEIVGRTTILEVLDITSSRIFYHNLSVPLVR